MHMPTNITFKNNFKKIELFPFLFKIRLCHLNCPIWGREKKEVKPQAQSNETSFRFLLSIAVLNLHWPLRIRSLCRNSRHMNSKRSGQHFSSSQKIRPFTIQGRNHHEL